MSYEDDKREKRGAPDDTAVTYRKAMEDAYAKLHKDDPAPTLYCPLSHTRCNDECAWYLRHGCAVVTLAVAQEDTAARLAHIHREQAYLGTKR